MSFIGPPLPPGLSGAKLEEERDKEEDDECSHGASTFEPQLPRHVTRQEAESINKPAAVSASSSYGPTLPSKPSSDDAATSSSYGPSLPPGLGAKERDEEEGGNTPNHSRVMGPALPPGVGVVESDEEDDDDIIGPMPVMGGVSEAEDRFRRKKEFEYRAKAMKDKILGKVCVNCT